MPKAWIRQVKATKDDGTTSVVDLRPGLNVVVGPSNTGKTRIAKTISYACGGKALPFTKKTGYTTAHVTFVTETGQVTLSRSTRPRSGITVDSTDPAINSGDYSVSRKAKRPINDLLVSFLGIDPGRKVVKNESFKKVDFTWDSVKHLMAVPESQVGRPDPSILFPRSNNPQTQTQNLSALLVLAQNENLNDVEQHESTSERRARRRAVERFIYRELDQIEARIEKIEEAEAQAKAEGKTLPFYMAELRTTLEQLEADRKAIIESDSECVRQMSELAERRQQLEVATSQRQTLITQYGADLARLDLRLQGMRHDRTHPPKSTCQFCQSAISTPQPTAEEIKAHEQEINRIRTLKAGATVDLRALMDLKEATAKSLNEHRKNHAANMATLKRELEPAANAIQIRLDHLAQVEKIKAERAELEKLRHRYDRELAGDNEAPDGESKFKPRELFRRSFFQDIQDTVRAILERARFSGANLAEFNRQTFDIDIDGYAKDDEQGKGYCAFFNTVLILAFHEYLNRNSAHAPGHLLIDSPLHGFDEGPASPNESMRAGLFAHLGEQAKTQQILILENSDKMQCLTIPQGTTLIEFTHKTNQGRYGYLEGVYDTGDEDKE